MADKCPMMKTMRVQLQLGCCDSYGIFRGDGGRWTGDDESRSWKMHFQSLFPLKCLYARAKWKNIHALKEKVLNSLNSLRKTYF